MIEQILTFLSRHIMWKGKEAIQNSSAMNDEDDPHEALRTQRDSLVEKLTEFAVGTQSNTVERVKRAVRPSRRRNCSPTDLISD
jgi:cohesin complex subunit SA-1/2